MTYLTHFSLQQEIYEKLTADTLLMAMVTGVFDHVPQGTEYPFITMGESSLRDFSNLEQQGTEAQATIRIFSREAGRKESALIMERITHLLQRATLAISGQECVDSRFVSSNIILQDEGLTHRGTLVFAVRMREVT